MKYNFKILLLIVLAIHMPMLLQSQETNQSIIAKIETQDLASVITIKGTVLSKTNLIKSLRYEMFVYKKNPENGNVSKGKQESRFVLKPSEKKELNQITFNKSEKDIITVLVLIYDEDDKLVAKDRKVVLNDNENQAKVEVKQTVSEDDIAGIRGIVIENTKTKPGRDFYIEFYSNYRLKGINGREVVKITEQFSFGRSTIMEVSVGGVVIHRFFVQPTQDFIKQQSQLAILNVTRYFLNLEQQKNYIKQY